LSHYTERLRTVLKEDGLSGLTNLIARKSKELITGKYNLVNAYDGNFFLFNLADSRPQAEWLAPKLAHSLGIKSMMDIGCATGHWVGAFINCGVDARGIEGSIEAKRHLVCPQDRVAFADLRKPLISPARDVDLVISLEVAEHIETKYADTFLQNIVRYNPKCIFLTAAPPGQGGHYHVNEQPFDYWINRLKKLGYALDQKTKDIVVSLVHEGRNLKTVPAIMKHPDEKHDGVWIPDWMPKNLLVFSKIKTV
jgi:hypothetical protein